MARPEKDSPYESSEGMDLEDPFPEGGTLRNCAFARQPSTCSSSALGTPTLVARGVPGPSIGGRRPLRRWRWRFQHWRARDAAFASPPPEPEEWTTGRRRFSSFGGSEIDLRWEGLSMLSWQGVGKRGVAAKVLQDVSGVAKPAHLTCILGPSGSGKTTLLNVLAGRQSGGGRSGVRIFGQVWAAGQRIDPRAVRSSIAYVMQKDEMFATATPREAFAFSAALRLPQPGGDRSQLVYELLGSLGLLRCADTCIGNAVINGLSGGQRKRTAIGVELITRPDIVCLDEPTSGLDSYAAYQVVKVLKDLASAGCTVICTLHQPSSEIFALVDRVICLCQGRCLYDGAREQMVQHFSEVGFRCPQGFNPADFVIFTMQTEPPERVDEAVRLWSTKRSGAFPSRQSSQASPALAPAPAPAVGAELQREHELRELCATPPRFGWSSRRARASSSSSSPSSWRSSRKSPTKQLAHLALRELRAAFRDRTTLAVRFCLSVVLAFFFGLIFRGVGKTILEKEAPDGTFDLLWKGCTYEEVLALRKQKLEWHFNAVVNVALVAMFSACQPVILTFPLERPVFLREHSSGAYDVVPYYLSKIAVEVPLVITQSLLTLTLCYQAMCLNGPFWSLLWTIVLLSVCSVSVALAIGCTVRQPRDTGAIGPLIFVPQMLFSGVFIPVSHMPTYLRWMQYGSFLQYAIKILGIVEFGNVPHRQVLLEIQDIDEDSLAYYICMLVLSVIVFSAMGIEKLRRKARHLF